MSYTDEQKRNDEILSWILSCMNNNQPHSIHIVDQVGTVHPDCPDCAPAIERIREIVRDEVRKIWPAES